MRGQQIKPRPSNNALRTFQTQNPNKTLSSTAAHQTPDPPPHPRLKNPIQSDSKRGKEEREREARLYNYNKSTRDFNTFLSKTKHKCPSEKQPNTNNTNTITYSLTSFKHAKIKKNNKIKLKSCRALHLHPRGLSQLVNWMPFSFANMDILSILVCSATIFTL